jgi:hypothetical protein
MRKLRKILLKSLICPIQIKLFHEDISIENQEYYDNTAFSFDYFGSIFRFVPNPIIGSEHKKSSRKPNKC